MITEDWF